MRGAVLFGMGNSLESVRGRLVTPSAQCTINVGRQSQRGLGRFECAIGVGNHTYEEGETIKSRVSTLT